MFIQYPHNGAQVYFVFHTNTRKATTRIIHSSVVVLIVTVDISIPSIF